MTRSSLLAVTTTLALIGASASSAQMPKLPSGGGGLLGAVLPDVASTSTGNAAGVLSYCVKNKLVGATSGASSVLGKLTGKPGVTSSPGFSLGQGGTLQTKDNSLSLGGLQDKMKSKLCDMVLNHATSLL